MGKRLRALQRGGRLGQRSTSPIFDRLSGSFEVLDAVLELQTACGSSDIVVAATQRGDSTELIVAERGPWLEANVELVRSVLMRSVQEGVTLEEKLSAPAGDLAGFTVSFWLVVINADTLGAEVGRIQAGRVSAPDDSAPSN